MRVSIVGLGKVGSALAAALAIQGLCEELVLVSQRAGFRDGEAHDLRHASSFFRHRIVVRAGDLAATRDSDILILTASHPAPPGSVDRGAVAAENTRLFAELVPRLVAYSPGASILVVSNPVDVLTHHVLRWSELPRGRVLGTGTLIDSARFRAILAERVHVHPLDLRAYIFGEHGPTQFPAVSLASIAGVRIDPQEARRAFADAVEGGLQAYRSKGYTSHAIAMAVCLLVEAMRDDSCITAPVSTRIDGYLGVRDVCLSVPVVVGRGGIVQWLEPELTAEEIAAFQHSAAAVRRVIAATQHIEDTSRAD